MWDADCCLHAVPWLQNALVVTSAKYSAICLVYAMYALRLAFDILCSSSEREAGASLLFSWPGTAAAWRIELRLPLCSTELRADSHGGTPSCAVEQLAELLHVLGASLSGVPQSKALAGVSGVSSLPGACAESASGKVSYHLQTTHLWDLRTFLLRSNVFSVAGAAAVCWLLMSRSDSILVPPSELSIHC